MKKLITALSTALICSSVFAAEKKSQNDTSSQAKKGTAVQPIAPTQQGQFRLQKGLPSKKSLPAQRALRNLILRGGGDAGGGNLINGHLLEEYQISINTTPEFKRAYEMLAVVFGGNYYAGKSLNAIVQQKAWYIAPVELPALSPEQIGVPFAVQQGALQDFDEIWIDSKHYLNMTSDEKVKFFLHEIFMGFVILKSESLSGLCNIYNDSCDDYRGLGDAVRKPLSLRLEDYKKVRLTVNAVWQNKEAQNYANIWRDNIGETAASLKKLNNYIFSDSSFSTRLSMFSPDTELTTFSVKDLAYLFSESNSKTYYCDYGQVKSLGNNAYKIIAKTVVKAKFSVQNEDVRIETTSQDRQHKIVNILVKLKSISNSPELNTESSLPTFGGLLETNVISKVDDSQVILPVELTRSSVFSFMLLKMRLDQDGKMLPTASKLVQYCSQNKEFTCHGSQCLTALDQ